MRNLRITVAAGSRSKLPKNPVIQWFCNQLDVGTDHVLRGPSLQNAALNQRKQKYEKYHSNCRGHRADVRLRLVLAHRPNDTAPTCAIDSMNTFPPLAPFTEETARQKVQAAEAAWNTRNPERVALAYTEDSEWRNRVEFVNGR